MSFKNYLVEELFKMDKVNQGWDNFIFEVYKNPNEYETSQIFDNFIEANNLSPKGLSKALRGIIDKKTNDLYVWNANLLHDKALNIFQLPIDHIRIVFSSKGKIIQLEGYGSSAYIDNYEQGILYFKSLNDTIIKRLLDTGYTILQFRTLDENDKDIIYSLDLKNKQMSQHEPNDVWD